MTCPTAEPLIARYADDPASLDAAERQPLELHLAMCEACRVVLDDQRHVARALHARPVAAVSPSFAAQLAARLDAEPIGWLAIANWRAWTVTLAPVAAVLVFIAWFGLATRTQSPVSSSLAPADTFETWTSSAAGEPAGVFLQSSNGDVLLEAVLTGTAVPAGESDVR
jgi:predicted anti-sigma-YlaC factor YlaD